MVAFKIEEERVAKQKKQELEVEKSYYLQNSPEDYLKKHPQGLYVSAAKEKIRSKHKSNELTILKSFVENKDMAKILNLANTTSFPEIKTEALTGFDKINYDKIKDSKDLKDLAFFYSNAKTSIFTDKVIWKAYGMALESYSDNFVSEILTLFSKDLSPDFIQELENRRKVISEFNETLSVFKEAKKDPSLLKSILLPGWGDIKPNNALEKEGRFGTTLLLSYGSAGLGLACLAQAENDYKKYNNSTDPEEWDSLLEGANTFNGIGHGLLAIGASVYLGDLINVMIKKYKVTKKYNQLVQEKKQGGYVMIFPDLRSNGIGLVYKF